MSALIPKPVRHCIDISRERQDDQRPVKNMDHDDFIIYLLFIFTPDVTEFRVNIIYILKMEIDINLILYSNVLNVITSIKKGDCQYVYKSKCLFNR